MQKESLHRSKNCELLVLNLKVNFIEDILDLTSKLLNQKLSLDDIDTFEQ